MIRTFETIEAIAHKVIDRIGNVALVFAKAVVTLLCLGGSIAYVFGQKLREVFYKNNAARPVANSDVSVDRVINVHVDDIEQIEQQPPQQINYAHLDADFTREKIVDVIQSINLVKPIVKVNSLENFVSNGLRDTLEANYLNSVSYKLPKNNRVRTKTHIRHGNIGILKEHYNIVIKSKLLS